MSWKKLPRQILLHLPYLLPALLAARVSQAWRLAAGENLSVKMPAFIGSLQTVFQTPGPGFVWQDILFGILAAVVLRLAIYIKSKDAKKFRHNIEYGSARWGTAKDIQPYIDPVFQNNVILTKTERLTMNSRPKDPKTAQNKNVLVIGGSGSGKTRYFIKPNLMQMHSSYVVTDPKGSIIVECGNLLQRAGYHIKILNTTNFGKSQHYNPFAYIHSEKDILKLVTCLIANTKGEGKAGDDFWQSATCSQAVRSLRTGEIFNIRL